MINKIDLFNIINKQINLIVVEIMGDNITEDEWLEFTQNAYNISYLKKHISNFRTIKTMIYCWQYNLVLIKLHVTKNNIMLPEIWDFIFGFVIQEIKKYNPINYRPLHSDDFIIQPKKLQAYNLTYYFRGDSYNKMKHPVIRLLDKIKIGQLCSTGGGRFGHMYKIIIDINRTDRTIASIVDNYEYCPLHLTYMEPLKLFDDTEYFLIETFEDFIGGYECDIKTYTYDAYYPDLCIFAKTKYAYFKY